MKNKIIHMAASRGTADFGWLKSRQTFSFGRYYDPARINFGSLRVLNDDIVDGGKGFGEHPHDNMEIISIPLEGNLIHEDSMGTKAVIKYGEIQAMSAGTGIYHSEFNEKEKEQVKFLQIWLFPNKKNVTPRYDQKSIPLAEKNLLHQILSPNPDDQGVWIYQNAWFYMGTYEGNSNFTYDLKDPSNGLYIFVLAGELQVADEQLFERDGLGLTDVKQVAFQTKKGTQVLLMEVPMQLAE
jgi:redox-sensitive bicupin YhaK (pirin superfamily)